MTPNFPKKTIREPYHVDDFKYHLEMNPSCPGQAMDQTPVASLLPDLGPCQEVGASSTNTQ